MANLATSQNLVTIIRNRAEISPDDLAVSVVSEFTDSPRCITQNRAELDKSARTTASWLQERFGAGDRALLCFQNGNEFTAAFVGCLYAGLVAVPAPPPGRSRQSRRRLVSIVRDAGVSVVLTDRAGLADLEKWRADEGIVGIPCVAIDACDGDPDAWRDPGVSPDTLALLQYTSGSTGQPKGVMVRHRHLVTNVDEICGVMGVDDSVRSGGWIPLHHDMGLIAIMLSGLLFGGGYVQMAPSAFVRRPHHWLRMLDELDVRVTASPNFGFELCNQRVSDDELAGLDLSRVITMINAAEPVRASTVRRFVERFGPTGLRPEAVAPMYGMAEATVFISGTSGRLPHRVTVDVPDFEQNVLRRVHDSGRELVGCGGATGFGVRIVDPVTCVPLPEGKIGEIWLAGPSVADGYWGDADATEETFRAQTADGLGPYLRTGDLGGWLDGELFITGRIKDVLVLYGRNLHPHDIESELRDQHEELAGRVGAVFTVDSDDGEAVVVVHEIQPKWDEQRLREIAVAMRQTVVSEFGIPVDTVVLVRPGKVRRTTSGKIQRSAMREEYLRGELDALIVSGTRQ